MEYQSKEGGTSTATDTETETDTDTPRSPLAVVGDCIMISIESSDGRIFQVNKAHASLSRLVRDATSMEESDNDDDGGNNDEMNAPIQLINVQSECLQHIVNFMKQYAQEPMVDISIQEEGAAGACRAGGSFTDIVQQEWYRSFVCDLDSSMLFQLVTAADYMDIQPLLSLTCLRVSSDLMGKSPEQIRDILNIPKLSATEEAEAREEHSWMFPDSS
jgi:S-phase kinase-associated protein 1